MSEMPFDPFNKYIFRPETRDYLYFPVTKLLCLSALERDSLIDIEKEIQGPVCYTLVYVRCGYVDGKTVYKFQGAL